ncbi:SAICAR synthase-like protein [Exidia glandulosa HHB12029]|uniref:SAICAR synthase-like protein n=1 Tax=Exidia glandulosa HHB12029 TaxID=1314781 RepID=A0A165HQ42_EXIGL|nr:SAICAR synthase-like protein [Exidia glandulosa HHB12029]
MDNCTFGAWLTPYNILNEYQSNRTYTVHNNAMDVEIWDLNADPLDDLAWTELSYKTRPKRRSLRARLTIKPGATSVPNFECPSGKLVTFEIACADADCGMEFHQDEATPRIAWMIFQYPRMDDFTRNILIGLLVLIVAHQISFRFLIDPSKYRERVTIRAAHRAFHDDKPDRRHPPDALLPYRTNFNWDRALNLYDLKLRRDAPAKFAELRRIWAIDEEEYKREVQGEWSTFGEAAGLSGSLFFHSTNKHYLLKSLGRAFENRFLHEYFLPAYFDYVRENPGTLLNRVLDVLCSFDWRLGDGWLSPSHFLVLENIAREKEDDWETLDLKPMEYLEPFRDLVPERIQGSGVTDVLPDSKPLLIDSAVERTRFLMQLTRDAEFLARMGAIDWSVLVVRPPDGRGWRIALIDVFWSLKTPRAHLTKVASDAAGIPTQTVTADAEGYAREVVRMMERAIRVEGGQ